MAGMKPLPLPRPHLSEQPHRLPITVVDMYDDLSIQILILSLSVDNATSALSFYSMK
jgi:hypothetical protein